MNGRAIHNPPAWWRHLDVVGGELLRRYRKRLMQLGISLEIWREYPELGLVDVLIRVHEACRIVRAGDDFEALAAIRDGWRPAYRQAPATVDRRRDRASRALILIGLALAGAFMVLTAPSVVQSMLTPIKPAVEFPRVTSGIGNPRSMTVAKPVWRDALSRQVPGR